MRDVAGTTWNWRLTESPSGGSAKRAMRGSAYLQAAILVVVGFALTRLFRHDLPSRVAWCLAAAIALLGTFWPRGYRYVHDGGRRFGRAVGVLLSYILLAPLYVTLFGLVAVYLRARRQDPLHREYLSGTWTYWIPCQKKRRDENAGDQFLREDREARSRRRPVGADTRRGECGLP